MTTLALLWVFRLDEDLDFTFDDQIIKNMEEKKMNALQQFLLESNVNDLKKTINIGGRMKDHPLTIRVITGQQYTDYQQQCIENPNSSKKRRFNTKRFNELICVNSLVDPNLKDPEMLKAAGVNRPEDLLYRCFLAGEINTIAEQALIMSGFDSDVEEEMNEVKNS